METRSIAIGLIAVVAAFAAAFGMAKSGGSKTETTGAGVKAKSIKVAAPAAVTGVEVGGTLPALKAERKAPAKKKKAASTTNTSTPSTSNTTTPSTTNTPSTNNTTTPQAKSPPVKIQVPVPNKQPDTREPAPAQGGGEDG